MCVLLSCAVMRCAQVVNERLSPNCKARLTVENDDRASLYHVLDLMKVHKATGRDSQPTRTAAALCEQSLAACYIVMWYYHCHSMVMHSAVWFWRVRLPALACCTVPLTYGTIDVSAGIPIVFDFHHWKFCTGDQTQEEAFRTALTTWPAGGGAVSFLHDIRLQCHRFACAQLQLHGNSHRRNGLCFCGFACSLLVQCLRAS